MLLPSSSLWSMPEWTISYTMQTKEFQVLISIILSENSSGWYNTQPITSSFQRDLNLWHAFNLLRIIGSIMGWLLICFDARSYNINPHEEGNSCHHFALTISRGETCNRSAHPKFTCGSWKTSCNNYRKFYRAMIQLLSIWQKLVKKCTFWTSYLPSLLSIANNLFFLISCSSSVNSRGLGTVKASCEPSLSSLEEWGLLLAALGPGK